jgi:Pentapeptide repeats (8 copies)
MNPAWDLRFGDFSGVDFSGCDLRGFDFTGARLHGCCFDGAMIAAEKDRPAARFDQAELGAVSHYRERGSTGPGILTPVASLKQAADWTVYADPDNWVKPARQNRVLRFPACFQAYSANCIARSPRVSTSSERLQPGCLLASRMSAQVQCCRHAPLLTPHRGRGRPTPSSLLAIVHRTPGCSRIYA